MTGLWSQRRKAPQWAKPDAEGNDRCRRNPERRNEPPRGTRRTTKGVRMRTSAWTGWIGFAGWMLLIIGMIDFFEGLIAVIRSEYYVLGPNQLVVFDTTTWGWITLLLGIVIALVGLGLLAGSGWARWTAIVVGSINFIAQLGFFGSAAYPLWALTAQALTLVVLYALIARWDDRPRME